MSNQRFFNVTYGTGKYADIRVRLDELDYTPSQARDFNLFIDSNGNKFISNELFKILNYDLIGEFPEIKFGRSGYYKITADRLDSILGHTQYERRSGFEQAVANRNQSIITKIIDL